ncbi:MAG: NAD(P)-dependent glycerol-3-phosphate dehydrogenase [Clostridia bacterium]|nr:NAD(P)-dependent glycerol-3-phosphate dehydrogenase [Clostridia bacterium]MBR3272112.1 NAD(P)-dependent glycerol-3-phosphate dehydrogenase [Clostridia bacterium]
MATIGILGAGTWGTALARMLTENGHAVTLWSALPEELETLRKTRRHPKLPDAVLPAALQYSADIAQACAAQIVVFAVPSVFIRSTAAAAKPFLQPETVLVSVAKGIEKDTFFTMTEILEDVLGKRRIVALSGPTHAEEVGVGLPTAIVSASDDREAAAYVQQVFSNAYFRTYTNADIRGVELCGALKNVIALAAGVGDGIGYGDNAKAALITRGMAEITRLGTAMGCDPRTFYGLAGVGDLIVTATSRHSRNNRCGYLLGKGLPADLAVKEVGMVVEGLNALPAALGLAERYGVEMPITRAVGELVYGGGDPKAIVGQLMRREYKNE